MTGNFISITGDSDVDEGGLDVTTNQPTNVESTAVTLEGTLDSLGVFPDANVFFEYAEVNGPVQETAAVLQSSTGPFSERVTGLTSGVEHVARAVAARDGTRIVGDDVRFTPTGPVTDGLVHWWKHDSGSGSTLVDSVGSQDGSIQGASWSNDAKTGGYSLDYSNDYVDVTGLDFGGNYGNSWTVTVWAKFDTLSDENTILGESGGVSTIINFQADEFQNAYFRMEGENGNLGVVTSTVNLNTGQWYHIAVTSAMEMYIDASFEGSDFKPDDTYSVNNSYIGSRGYSAGVETMDGHLDDLRIYDRELSQSEIQKIYDNTK